MSGHVLVEPGDRAAYLEGCTDVVERARATPGCLDFALSPDLLDPGRVNVLERWSSREAVEEFRGSGVSAGQAAVIRSAVVTEHEVTAERRLS
ncbi:putative quinol monooxygenase [Nocardioides sp. SYSU D00038]|uniref:putative quinol monooxygenase n=1 Tax=Nocardioides sp. SYSU D00038 TaxID=2812554 RepID=UPI0019689E34|nr:antibiotic biosynthesis monooxygenase [Nocardioides sp. SYSU D00038]